MARALCIAAAGLVAVLGASYLATAGIAWLYEDEDRARAEWLASLNPKVPR